VQHVLLIGSQPTISDLMQSVLREDGGYRVTHASSGDEALPLFRRKRPSLAIIDQAVPGMPGIELAQRARRAHVPVLLLTDNGKPPFAEPGFATLRKPVALDDLLERSRRLIDEAKRQHYRLRASIDKLRASRQALRIVLRQVRKTIARAPAAQCTSGHVPAFDFRVDPILREALAYWEAKHGARTMPRRRDIDPAELPKHLLPQLQLIDVVDGGRRFHFRLVGTAIVEEFGREYTGKYTDDLIAAQYVDALHACYRLAIETHRPVFVRSRYSTSREMDVTANRLLMPLSEDGEQVSMILCALTFERLCEPPTLPWTPIAIAPS
jgi:DNA-binding NarL/FixJ family response regulator